MLLPGEVPGYLEKYTGKSEEVIVATETSRQGTQERAGGLTKVVKG